MTFDQECVSILLDKRIAFRIRIRENMLISNARGILVPAKTLFRDLRVGEYKILHTGSPAFRRMRLPRRGANSRRCSGDVLT